MIFFPFLFNFKMDFISCFLYIELFTICFGIFHNLVTFFICNDFHNFLPNLPIGGPFFEIKIVKAISWGIWGTYFLAIIPSIIWWIRFRGTTNDEFLDILLTNSKWPISLYMFSFLITGYNWIYARFHHFSLLEVANLHQNYGYFFGIIGFLLFTFW